MDPAQSKLSLNAFLKLLTSNDVPVSKAMAVASKVSVLPQAERRSSLFSRYKQFNTATTLAQLDDAKLIVLGVEDKELRTVVLTAIHKAGYTTEASSFTSKPSIAVNCPSFPLLETCPSFSDFTP